MEFTKKYKEVFFKQAIELKLCKNHWRYKNSTEENVILCVSFDQITAILLFKNTQSWWIVDRICLESVFSENNFSKFKFSLA